MFTTNMPVHRPIPYEDGIYFITFTCYDWISLIDLTNGYDLVYNWFNVLKKKGHYILGYVIMPNHVHSLLAFQMWEKTLIRSLGMEKDLWHTKS